MKIEGNKPVAQTSRRGRVKSANGASFEAEGAEQSESRAVSGPGQVSALSSVDALLALQTEYDDRSPSDRASTRAFSLLDILDEIKLGLLEGGIPGAKLRQLVQALGTERESTGDARLEGLLDEVETRALVELAKHETAIS